MSTGGTTLAGRSASLMEVFTRPLVDPRSGLRGGDSRATLVMLCSCPQVLSARMAVLPIELGGPVRHVVVDGMAWWLADTREVAGSERLTAAGLLRANAAVLAEARGVQIEAHYNCPVLEYYYSVLRAQPNPPDQYTFYGRLLEAARTSVQACVRADQLVQTYLFDPRQLVG